MEYYDENDRLIEKSEYSGGSAYFRDKGFLCKKCFKLYFTPWNLKKHSAKCFIRENGFILVDKHSPNHMKHIAGNIGDMSKQAQRIDFSMTNITEIDHSGKRVLLYFEDWFLKGLITFYEKTLASPNNKKERRMTLDDIYVPMPYRHKGIGTKLVKEMLNITKMNPKKIVINQPNEKCMKLTKEFGFDKFY